MTFVSSLIRWSLAPNANAAQEHDWWHQQPCRGLTRSACFSHIVAELLRTPDPKHYYEVSKLCCELSSSSPVHFRELFACGYGVRSVGVGTIRWPSWERSATIVTGSGIELPKAARVQRPDGSAAGLSREEDECVVVWLVIPSVVSAFIVDHARRKDRPLGPDRCGHLHPSIHPSIHSIHSIHPFHPSIPSIHSIHPFHPSIPSIHPFHPTVISLAPGGLWRCT